MSGQRYALDTNICSYLLKERAPAALQRLRQCRADEVFLSAVVVSELRFGARKRGSAKLSDSIERWVSCFVLEPWPIEASEHYAEARSALERAGTPIGNMDLLLASHALALDAVVVTNNRSEFDRVPGLLVEDWSVAS